MAPSSFRASMSLLRTRRFGIFWFSSLLSNIGTWAQQVAEPWLLLSLGATPFLVGLDAFALSAPVWLLTLPGGVLADRGDRRRVIAGFQSAQMLCPLLLIVLLLAHAVQPWMVIALSLVVGVTDALSMPSFASIVPSIVARQDVGAGIALNATQFNLSRVLGPALAGLLLVSVGAIGCFAVNVASYIPFIGVALWILPRRARRVTPTERFTLRHPFAGVGTILRAGHLRSALLTTLFSSTFCTPLLTFCPVLVKDVLGGDAGQYSLATAIFGVGGVFGSLTMLAVSPERDRRRLAGAFAIAFGATLVLAARLSSVAVLPVVMALGGVALSVTNTCVNTLLQSSAGEEIRGQAVSLFLLAMRGGLALGSLLTGLLIGVLGVRHALLLDGILAIAAQIWISAHWPSQPAEVA